MLYTVKFLPNRRGKKFMYLLFRHTYCLHCKCGIFKAYKIFYSPGKSLRTSQAADQDCGYIWFISVAWSSQECFFFRQQALNDWPKVNGEFCFPEGK